MARLQQRGLFTAIAMLLMIAVSRHATANVLVEWDTFGTTGDQATQPAEPTTPPGVTGLPITRNGGLNATVANNSLNSNGWATNIQGDPVVLNPGAYVELGFELVPGYVADLDALWLGSRSSSSGPALIGVYTSADNFAAPIATITQSNTDFTNSIIDLSSLTGITGQFTIRFYNDGGTLSANGSDDVMYEFSTWRVGDHFAGGVFTNTQITGSVIPEPGSLALLGLGGLALLARRRGK